MCILRPQCEHASLVAPLGTWSLVQCYGGGASQPGRKAILGLVLQLKLYKAKRGGGSKTANRVGHLQKIAVLTVRTRFETIQSGSKQKQNERFAWDFPQNTAPDPVRNKGMSVRKRETAWDFLAKVAFSTVPKRFKTIEVGSKRLENKRFA